MPKVESVRAERRSSNTLGMEMVVALKITPPQAVATVRTANTRARSARESLAGPLLRAGACPCASRANSTNATPTPRAIAPGTMNAARQPTVSASAPAISAENATPTLPKTPFTPRTRPTFSRFATSMAMPTGW